VTEDWVNYWTAQTLLSNGTATVETAVSVAALVPTDWSTLYRVVGNASIYNNLGGNVDRSSDVSVILRWVSGADWFRSRMRTDVMTQYQNTSWTLDLPPSSALGLYYIWGTHTFCTVRLDLEVLGYQIGK
jgi:hypothetical protein